MKFGAYQFCGSGNISQNFEHICQGIRQAAQQQVRFLLFHECALTGYPPLHTALSDIDFAYAERCLQQISALAKENAMYLAVGSVTRQPSGPCGNFACHNSILVFSPQGTALTPYHKRALWGWDREHFTEGENDGIYQIDHLRVGIRVCFEVRFPEFFRELYKANADLCAISFCDISKQENSWRYQLITGHLQTRAVENVMPVLSVNDSAFFQTAPTAAIDIHGEVEQCLSSAEEGLLLYEYEPQEAQFGELGRRFINDRLLI